MSFLIGRLKANRLDRLRMDVPDRLKADELNRSKN